MHLFYQVWRAEVWWARLRYSSVVEYLPSIHEVLGLMHSTTGKGRGRRRDGRVREGEREEMGGRSYIWAAQGLILVLSWIPLEV